MFDLIRFAQYHIPDFIEIRDTESYWQTHSLDELEDNYEIREDGTLWREIYDIEDRSDPNATGLDRLRGTITRVNCRWVRYDHTGEIHAYTSGCKPDQEIGVRFWLRDGVVKDVAPYISS